MTKISPWIFIKMALISLKRHPIRSGLAFLGIMIGIIALVVIMALGQGADEEIQKQILGTGRNWINITSGGLFDNARLSRARVRNNPLTVEDYQAIRNQLGSAFKVITPYLFGSKFVSYQGAHLQGQILGVNHEYSQLSSRKVVKGMFFTAYHNESSAKVAVLGAEAAQELFGKKDPLGKMIFLESMPFKVVGVLEKEQTKQSFGYNHDLEIIVPFKTVWRKLLTTKRAGLHAINLSPKDPKKSAQLVASLKRLLRFRHQLKSHQPDDFTIWDQQALLKAAQKSSKTLQIFLTATAAISLIVGGIGIMNIMLVSMTERKKEIGLKMAIGATSTHILLQFLLESVLLCFMGGIIGVALGIAASYLVGYFTAMPWVFSYKPLLIALCTTTGIGLFFGLYPASQASKLNPIDALHTA